MQTTSCCPLLPLSAEVPESHSINSTVCVGGAHVCRGGLIYTKYLFRDLCVCTHACILLSVCKGLAYALGKCVHEALCECAGRSLCTAQHLCDVSGLQVSLCALNPTHLLSSECRLYALCRVGGQQAGGTLLRKSIHKDLVGWALPSCLPSQDQATATASYIRADSRA